MLGFHASIATALRLEHGVELSSRRFQVVIDQNVLIVMHALELTASGQKPQTDLLFAFRTSTLQPLGQGLQAGRRDKNRNGVGPGLDDLNPSLHVDVENDVSPLAEMLFHRVERRTVEAVEDFVPFQEAALFHPVGEDFGVQEIIVLSVDLTRARRAGGGGNREDAVLAVLEQATEKSALTHARGTGDNQKQTSQFSDLSPSVGTRSNGLFSKETTTSGSAARVHPPPARILRRGLPAVGRQRQAMSLDSLNARALLLELYPRLCDSRLQKFSQLSELDFILHLRSPGRTDRLLISLHPERSRFHLSADSAPPAIVPSAFVMLGRKHAGGCRVVELALNAGERSLEIEFSSGYRLVFDWTARPSALLLLEPENGLCVGAYPSRGRFLSRQPYPLSGQPAPDEPQVPPLWARRLEAEASPEKAWQELLEPFRQCDPTLLRPGLEADGELSFRPGHVVTPFPSMSLAAAARWEESTRAPGVPDHRVELLRTLRKGRDKAQRKLEKREKDKAGAESAPRDQLFGDLLLAYGSTLSGRLTEFRTTDWEGRPVTIPLDPFLSATENAERYYLRAKKKKRALAVLDEQLALAAEEIAFWEELIFAAEGAENRTDLEEVRKAVPGTRQGKAKRAPEVPSSGPRRFEHGGFQLLVGRNPAQNEKLSLREASKDDHWFHVRSGAGSHVLLRAAGRVPGEDTIKAAAWLAACHSRSHLDPRTAVVTTLARYLKKPKGGPLGKVTYRSERELTVDPTSSPPEGLRRTDKKENAP